MERKGRIPLFAFSFIYSCLSCEELRSQQTIRERALGIYPGLVEVTAQATFAKILTCYERRVQKKEIKVVSKLISSTLLNTTGVIGKYTGCLKTYHRRTTSSSVGKRATACA